MEKSKFDLEQKEDLTNIIYGLVKNIEEVFGKEKAREIAYKTGFEEGKKLGMKLGKSTPEKALELFTENAAPYYKFEVVSIEKKQGNLEITVQFRECIIMKVLESHDLPYPAGVCRLLWGYIEGALSTMTGKMTKVIIYQSSISDACVGMINMSSLPEMAGPSE